MANVGRPSDYDPAVCEKFIKEAASGAGKTEIFVKLGIPRTTFYRWQEQYAEFREAVKQGEAIAQAWWEERGRAGATGGIQGFNATAFIFQMKNRFPDDWRDVQQREHSGPRGGPIELRDLSRLTDDELDDLERIRTKLTDARTNRGREAEEGSEQAA